MVPRLGSGGFTAPAAILRAAFLAAALVVAQAAVLAGAQSEGGISLSASAGFDSYFKEGRWIPVRVGLANQGPDVEVLLEVFSRPAAAGRASQYSQSISLPAGARKDAALYVYPTAGTRSLHIRLTVQDRLISESELPLIGLSSSDTLVGVIAADPTPFNLMRNPVGQMGATRVEIAWLSAEDLPERGPALGGLDALIIDDQDTGTLSTAQRQALAAWVASGGRLLVCGGPNWQKTTAGLTGLLPVDVTGTQLVASLESVGSYLGAGSGPPGETILAVGIPTADAEVFIEQGELPVALARRFGMGQIVFLAADPTLAPLDDWPATPSLYRALLLDGPYVPAGPLELQESSAAEAASLFPNLTLPPIGAVCGFLVLYTFALGPLHYFLLRRAKRRELAWITIPALVVVFSGVAIGVGSLSRGSRPVLNRLAVVHVPAGAERAQVTGVLGIFSPKRRALEIKFPPGLLARPLPGGYSLADGDWQFHQTEAGPGDSRMQFDAASVRGLVFEGDVAAPKFSHSLTVEVVGSAFQVQGQVASLELRLENAALLTHYGAIALGDLDPDEPRQVRESLPLSMVAGDAYWETLSALGAMPSAYPYGSSSVNEIELIRRGSLLAAIQPAVDDFARSGMYLVGWSDSAPLQVELASASDAEDLTLYLFELEWALEPATQPAIPPIALPGTIVAPTRPPGVMLLDPDYFTWQVLQADPPGSSPSPYGAQVMQGSYTLSFTPAIGISYRSVQGLVMHLEGYSTGPEPEELISLWDFNAAAWETIPGLTWGDTPIPDPGDYVGSGGEIRLRVESAQEGVTVVLQRSDFTMVLEP